MPMMIGKTAAPSKATDASFQQEISNVGPSEEGALPELAGGGPRKEGAPGEVRGYFLHICAPIPNCFPQSRWQLQAGSRELPGLICSKI